ncbi:hypothetical protein SAMN05444411_108100 [Lutibacter oricola]|uniref:Uncharacterized protein n=1 Tax=Lutibacter oricola TaxID=762486 RepID=A0A1H3DZ46_9FLAO|nr:hypothetical protein [Lutibacter oricola]SDX70944.1 hypothetical protein SAMN05444411_108100 [Lutibacter oricola]
MSKKFSKILTLVAGLIGLIGFYFFIRIMMEGDEAIEAMLADDTIKDSIVSPFITFAKFTLIATALLAVVFSIVNMIKNPQGLKTTLIGVAAFGVILAIAYMTASDAAVLDVSGRVLENGEAGSVSKWVSTGINFSALLGGVGLLFFLIDFGRSFVK